MTSTAKPSPAPETTELLSSLDEGYALPSRLYTDPEYYSLERDGVLRRAWHFGVPLSELARNGDQALCDVAGIPIVLVRSKDGVQGFVNICRHRAHPVVLEAGNRKTLQCLYHGWTYGLDGCLHRAPRAESELEFDASQFGLLPVQTAVWGSTVWVNPDREAAPFFEWIAGLPEVTAANGVDLDEFTLGFVRRWEIQANWKVLLDNAIECYHCPTCHPSLSKVIEMDPDLLESTVGGRFWTHSRTPIQQHATETYTTSNGSADATEAHYHFHWIFPTTYLQYVATATGARFFDIGSIRVRSQNEIELRSHIFTHCDNTETELAERIARADADPTVSEDVAICNRVQMAHEASAAPPGRLLPRTEWGLLYFQRILLEELAAMTTRG